MYTQVVMKTCSKKFAVSSNYNVLTLCLNFSVLSSSRIKKKCIPQLGSCVGECSFPIFCNNFSGFQQWSSMVWIWLSRSLKIVHAITWNPATGFCKRLWIQHATSAIFQNISCLLSQRVLQLPAFLPNCEICVIHTCFGYHYFI